MSCSDTPGRTRVCLQLKHTRTRPPSEGLQAARLLRESAVSAYKIKIPPLADKLKSARGGRESKAAGGGGKNDEMSCATRADNSFYGQV